MTFRTKLYYHNGDAYEPEREREDLSHQEWELLTQDTTYQRLAEIRWLADDLEQEIGRDDLSIESHAYELLFEAVAAHDAPLQQMVDDYVDKWLAAHRSGQEAEV